MDMSSFFRSQSESPNACEKKPPNMFDEKTIHLVIHNSNRMSLTKEDIPIFTDQPSMDSVAVHASELNHETCAGSSVETGEVLELISVPVDMFCNLQSHACLLYLQERCLANTLCNAGHYFL
jgi:hypothetical protein